MNCSDFIQGFSEYLDGVAASSFAEEADGHLASCRKCRRYLEVVERGTELLRSFPEVEVTEDFYPRLQHRIYHVDDEEALGRGASGSATTAVTVLGMAVLLTAVAWTPLLRAPEPEVELSPIVVSRPPARPLGLRPPPVSLLTTRSGEPAFQVFPPDLWESPHLLLYQHSPLSEKYRGGSPLRRTGLD